MSIGEGELSFDANVSGKSQRLWIRTDSPVTPNADAALAACLMPAMVSGGRLKLSEPISPRILRTQRDFQTVQCAWSLEWPFGDPPLREVEVLAQTRPPEFPQGNNRVAAFFSGGVDSWSMILENPDITDLIFARGVDLVSRWEHHAGLVDEVEARLQDAADELGLPLHVVDTNLRDFSDQVVRWEYYFGCSLTMIALFLQPMFDRILFATAGDFESQTPIGSSSRVDRLWSTESLEIDDDGSRYSRVERTTRISSHPVVQRTLRVCWRNPNGAYNCGRCRKCLMTMIALDAVGALEKVSTFPSELDLSEVSDIEIDQLVLLGLWEDVLDLVRESGRRDLEQVVDEVVSRGKRTLGLPPDHRTRSTPGPPPLGASHDLVGGQGTVSQAAEDRDARELLDEVLSSRSWRMTAPLRSAAERLRSLRDD